MRKIFTLFILLVSILTFAQTTFTPGVRGGVNFAKLTESDGGFYDILEAGDDYWPDEERVHTGYTTDFYLGVLANMRFSKLYALQPEINYSRQGSIMKTSTTESKTELSYISLQAINKFYYKNFNAHAGLSVDVMIASKNFSSNTRNDLGVILGAGYDITKNFGVEARFKKGLVSQIKTTSENHTNVLFQLGVTYNFNTKKINDNE